MKNNDEILDLVRIAELDPMLKKKCLDAILKIKEMAAIKKRLDEINVSVVGATKDLYWFEVKGCRASFTVIKDNFDYDKLERESDKFRRRYGIGRK